MERFPGYRQIGMHIVYVSFLSLIVFGYVMVWHNFPELNHMGNWVGLIFLTLFLGFFAWVLLYSFLHDLAYYKVGKDGIALCSPVHRNTWVSYSEIKIIKWLTSEEITQFWHEYQLEFLGTEIGHDLSSIFKMRKVTKYLTRYSTINPSYRATSIGSERNITTLKTFKVKGNFILLTTTSGKSFYMTPENPELMMERLNSYLESI